MTEVTFGTNYDALLMVSLKSNDKPAEALGKSFLVLVEAIQAKLDTKKKNNNGAGGEEDEAGADGAAVLHQFGGVAVCGYGGVGEGGVGGVFGSFCPGGALVTTTADLQEADLQFYL